MKLQKAFLIGGLISVFAISAYTQVPAAQPGVAKVGIVASDRFTDPTTGITRLTNALRSVDAEFKARRDEIAALVTRFEAAQRLPAGATREQVAAKREEAETLQLQIQRKQEDARVAYTKRFSAVTDPIRQSIFTALSAFAKQRGIDVLVDASKFPDGVYLLNAGADITPAFIRDYNSRNP